MKDLKLEKQEKIVKFVASCVNICSDMRQHDPQLLIDFQDLEKTDKAFDLKLYRAYRIDGSRLDYVVWPPLYQRTLLTKGVAQGKD